MDEKQIDKSGDSAAYERPELRDYGNLAEITQTVGGAFSDVQYGDPVNGMSHP